MSLLPALRRYLPPERWALLDLVRREAEALGLPLYIVGGFLRDWFLGRPGLDFDLVVEGPAPHLARHLARKYGGRVRVHKPFLTAKWYLPEALRNPWPPDLQRPAARAHLPPFLDLITARREHYPYPGALPQVEPADIQADLARRDFTINAMALALAGPQAGTLLDPFHGRQDLQAGLLRPLHPRSFYEDPTRITRAARYAARYGFSLSEEGMAQLSQARPVLHRVSGDRWRHELDLILQEPKAFQALQHLTAWDVLPHLHPALPTEPERQHRVDRWQPPSAAWGLPATWKQVPLVVPVRYALWWLDAPDPDLARLQTWLHLPGAIWETIQAAARLWRHRDRWGHLSPGPLTLYLERAPLPAVYALFLAAEGPLREKLQAFGERWRHVPPPLTGHDLKALGIPPGPHYRRLLDEARIGYIEGRFPDRESALAWVKTQWHAQNRRS